MCAAIYGAVCGWVGAALALVRFVSGDLGACSGPHALRVGAQWIECGVLHAPLTSVLSTCTACMSDPASGRGTAYQVNGVICLRVACASVWLLCLSGDGMCTLFYGKAPFGYGQLMLMTAL